MEGGFVVTTGDSTGVVRIDEALAARVIKCIRQHAGYTEDQLHEDVANRSWPPATTRLPPSHVHQLPSRIHTTVWVATHRMTPPIPESAPPPPPPPRSSRELTVTNVVPLEETQQQTTREDAPVRRRRYPPSYSIHNMIRRSQVRADRSQSTRSQPSRSGRAGSPVL